jgi:hypothetical protein
MGAGSRSCQSSRSAGDSCLVGVSRPFPPPSRRRSGQHLPASTSGGHHQVLFAAAGSQPVEAEGVAELMGVHRFDLRLVAASAKHLGDARPRQPTLLPDPQPSVSPSLCRARTRRYRSSALDVRGPTLRRRSRFPLPVTRIVPDRYRSTSSTVMPATSESRAPVSRNARIRAVSRSVEALTLACFDERPQIVGGDDRLLVDLGWAHPAHRRRRNFPLFFQPAEELTEAAVAVGSSGGGLEILEVDQERLDVLAPYRGDLGRHSLLGQEGGQLPRSLQIGLDGLGGAVEGLQVQLPGGEQVGDFTRYHVREAMLCGCHSPRIIRCSSAELPRVTVTESPETLAALDKSSARSSIG